tara:strand:+ start:672 stop:1547 length:876 start_codon:yes stop_codon:yes gene_type:complete
MDKINKELSIIIPSRGRPELLLKMMESVLDFAALPELIEFVIYLDNDESSDYEMFNSRAIIVKGERVHMGKMFSSCIEKANGRTIIICNDDVLVKTNNWDDIIYKNLKLFTDDVFLMYPNDLNKGEKLCTFPIFSKELFLKFPGVLPADLTLIDLHLQDLFFQLKGLGMNRIKFLHNVIFEHLHYTLGKSNFDETYSKRHRFENDDLFILYADLRFKLSSEIFQLISNDVSSKKFLSSKFMEPKMTSVRYLKESLLMFWFNRAPLFYRFKLLLYMIARRIYNIFIYRFKSS